MPYALSRSMIEPLHDVVYLRLEDSVSKAVPLGTYWRISPLVFSLSPRSQAWSGMGKIHSRVQRLLIVAWWANSLPLLGRNRLEICPLWAASNAMVADIYYARPVWRGLCPATGIARAPFDHRLLSAPVRGRPITKSTTFRGIIDPRGEFLLLCF